MSQMFFFILPRAGKERINKSNKRRGEGTAAVEGYWIRQEVDCGVAELISANVT